ncbi:MAG: hypothetical protein JXP73_09970 [Deltaproteobacteria bacterium]|jgi:hypothetical protein|nr:hypothetical protein [Deltaproteobacteria bacterium]
MSTRKTVRVPIAADGIPVVVDRRQLDKTREIRDDATPAQAEQAKKPGPPEAPREILEDDVTVPVHSSIESSLTFEVLRRQTTDDEEGKKKP